MKSRADAAVERALDARQREAAEDVERILAAAVAVMERAAPAEPRVSDIVVEAGISNKAFYRYFGGKDDLVLAVMERGIGIVRSYLEHQMAKEEDPAGKVARWIRGSLAQLSDARLARVSRAVSAELIASADLRVAEEEITRPLRDLLLDPVAELGSADPRRDADAVFAAVFGTMRRLQALDVRPGHDDAEHLVGFCLNALGPGVGRRSDR
ncbi:TetR/AcrR family transcriptional regulator [Streptomyces sp. NBC_00554]|uniref:TetR/AcrR family transcriptional regulator n=1 Tax=Streptomyces sp. NBC_00554 TaxID=2903661 RepID=UPI00352D78E5|nr:TetR/AcrR family transcriptional regulator [Streptomyces sp. NBC_00554]